MVVTRVTRAWVAGARLSPPTWWCSCAVIAWAGVLITARPGFPGASASTAWLQLPAAKLTVRLWYLPAGPGSLRTALSLMVPPARLCTSSVTCPGSSMMVRLTPSGVVTIICRTVPVAASETAAAVRARISAADSRAEALSRAWVLVSRAEPMTRLRLTVTPTATPRATLTSDVSYLLDVALAW